MAAGLGFKTFNTGDVLSAADTNGYLMQGVLVFADAAARDAAITSPQEGQCCYLKDTDAVQTYSGTAWVGFDDSNAIQNAIVDAKGDIVAASGNDTPARLAVGNNGDTLVADSSTSTGLRYQAPVNFNPVLNSAFQVWQRGTSGTANSSAAGAGYNADRWQNAATGNAITVARQATNDTTNLPFIQYCARVQRNSGQTGTSPFYHTQAIETINSIPFVGKTVTVSFYARAGANYSAASSALGFQLQTGTGTDQNIFSMTGAAYAINSSATLTSTWQRFTFTTASVIATSVTQLGLVMSYSPVGTAGANDYYEITGVQIEVGSVATPFKTYAGTIQGELAACQRYYFRLNSANNSDAYMYVATGMANATTLALGTLFLPTTMRTSPSLSSSGTWMFYNKSIVTTTSSQITSDGATPQQIGLSLAGMTGLTAGDAGIIRANNNNTSFLEFSSEL
jgi:hypothetical protein